MSNDPTSDDLPGSIQRYLQKLAPGQTRIYCKPLPEDKRDPEWFYGQCPIGKSGINKLFKDGAKILGLPNSNKADQALDCRINKYLLNHHC